MYLLVLTPRELTPAEFLERVTAVTRPLFDSFFGAAAVVGALLVALAVATGFGRRRRELDDRQQTSVDVASGLSALVLLVSAAGGPISALAEPAIWPQVIIVIATTMALITAADLITADPPASERLAARRVAASNALANAEAQGYETTAPSPWRRIVAEVCFWLVPLGLWTATAWILVTPAIGTDWFSIVLPIPLVAATPWLMCSVVWRRSASLASPPVSRRTARSASLAVGLVFCALLTVAMVNVVPMPYLAPAYAVFSVLFLSTLHAPEIYRMFPSHRYLEQRSTAASLDASAAAVRRAEREVRRVPAR